jgi:transcription elongation factor Elf1
MDSNDIYEAVKLGNQIDRLVAETIDCLHCGETVATPFSKELGYGQVQVCSNCGAKYFAEMPEDSLETLQQIAESFGVSFEDMNVRITRDFDTLKDEATDETGEEIALYSAKPR